MISPDVYLGPFICVFFRGLRNAWNLHQEPDFVQTNCVSFEHSYTTTERRRSLNGKTDVPLIDQAGGEATRTVTSLNWFKRSQSGVQQLFEDQQFIPPILDNFSKLAQRSLDEIEASFANLRIVIPDSGLIEKVVDPSVRQLNPEANLRRIVRNALGDLLANLRLDQAALIEVEFRCFTEDETFVTEDLPEDIDPLNQIGFLAETQMERLIDLVILLLQATTTGMPLNEMRATLISKGQLSSGTALALMNLASTTHAQLLLDNERADLAELLTLCADNKAISGIESFLHDAAKNLPTLREAKHLPELLLSKCFFFFFLKISCRFV